MRCSVVLGVALALAVVHAIPGCTPAICSRTSDCLTGRVCTTYGRCEVPVDASTVIDGTGTSDDAGPGQTDLPDAATGVPIDAAVDATPDGNPIADGGP